LDIGHFLKNIVTSGLLVDFDILPDHYYTAVSMPYIGQNFDPLDQLSFVHLSHFVFFCVLNKFLQPLCANM